MRTNRLIAGAVAAGLLGLTPIAIASPSSATENRTATVTATPSETSLVYGDDLSISVRVTDATDGTGVYDGTSTLYAMEAGAAAFVPVATGTSTSAYFTDVKPKINTIYKIVYSGYTATSTYENNYAAAESAPFTIGVGRKITAPKKGFVLKGKVSPDGAKKKITISVSKKSNKGFKKWKTIKTNKKGKYKVTLPKRGGVWYWNVIVKGDSKYLANGYTWRTYVY
ncbi:hypothetical protein SAMN04489844_0522 [Nocardioides exalbidus]|uniref:Bacterial Ig domain-containing protein n=1 Tax=Nocardioides exalbidus TaxID=402596 RepID=A0A1H4KBX6_9ACTN|nr:hypothetical protein [Nocardioides exalbidus]SEB55933.1 hypothetical protein SAMN04489844_0522 [Nocardioides exalbidus]